jgi:cell division protein FtsQ
MIKRNRQKLIGISIVFVVLIGAVLLLFNIFSVKDITITGNEHYTEDEIEKMVFANRYCYNSLYLYWKYDYQKEYKIPFIDTIDVEVLSDHKVKINVYEKSIVGYIEYLGSYMYFDKDGIVVEGSSEKIGGVPLVTGLKFNHIMLYQMLAVDDESVFNTIVSVTQLLNKYEIVPDKIYFDSNYEMTLYFGNAKVYFGKDNETEEKIIRLRSILPDLEGLSGVLHMETYQEGDGNITFEKDERN